MELRELSLAVQKGLGLKIVRELIFLLKLI